jgi:RNA polymerase sigma-70 factor, ECF subfamily
MGRAVIDRDRTRYILTAQGNARASSPRGPGKYGGIGAVETRAEVGSRPVAQNGQETAIKPRGNMISDALATTSGTVGFTTRATLDETAETREKTRLAVARAKEGDQDALRFLYISYSNNIYGYVRSIVRDDHEAEDVTQHVFAKLMTTIGKYNDRGVPFVAWLLRIAHNVAIDHLRANRLTPTETVVDPGAPSDVDLDQAEALRSALAALPDEQREVVLLRHVVGLTPREIAIRMGRTEGSIHGLHHRGRRALQRELRLMESTPSTRPTTRQLVAA